MFCVGVRGSANHPLPFTVNLQPPVCVGVCVVCMCGWFTKSDPACGDTAQGDRRVQSGVRKVGRDRARGGGDQTAALWRELQNPPNGNVGVGGYGHMAAVGDSGFSSVCNLNSRRKYGHIP